MPDDQDPLERQHGLEAAELVLGLDARTEADDAPRIRPREISGRHRRGGLGGGLDGEDGRGDDERGGCVTAR